MKLRLAATAAALALATVAGPAAADWRRAESEHFIVYSDGRESSLRDYVRRLELFDRILRLELNADRTAIRKLPIFLVGGEHALREIHPYLPYNAAGVYIPSTEDIFAVAVRNHGDDYVLHEYVHHMMYQMMHRNSADAYPAWMVEGFAEYYAAAGIEDDEVLIGGFNRGRLGVLAYGSWIPLRDLLTKPYRDTRGASRDSYYPVAWLLTHWFLGSQERRPQLAAYLRDVATGTPSVEAMEKATGMTPEQLQQELRRYLSSSVPQRRYTGQDPNVEMTVTVLPPSANDLLLINQRLRVSAPENERAGVVAEVRRRAARHPDDPLALLAIGHAELHFGDPDAGEASLTRLLELQPDHVEALQLMATRYFRLSVDRAEERLALIARGRTFLARAYQADPGHYYTLLLLGQSREGAANYPTENDLETWLQAFQLAPQLPASRLGLASALMRAGRNDEAAIILPALANAPHGGPASDAAKILLARALAGQAPLTEGEIATAAEGQVSTGADQPIPPGEETPSDGEPEEEPEDGPATPPA